MEAAKKARYECDICKMRFDRVERLQKHQQRGCKHTTCSTCKEKFRDVVKLGEHQRKHNAEALTRCTTCNKKFYSNRDLQSHQKNADPKACDVCDKRFCHVSEMERHKRTEHTGQGISAKPDDSKLSQSICPRTGLEDSEGYKDEINNHWSEIRGSQSGSKYYTEINKELTPGFTYKDLKDMLDEIYAKQTHVFKINLGFGFMLQHVVTDEFRYFYPSSNNLLFDRAFTVSTKKDMTSLLKRIVDLDLVESFYMKRPSSGWIVAGLPNLHVKLMYLTHLVLG